MTFQRDALHRALGGDRRLVADFEQLAATVESTAETAGSAVAATEAIGDASVVTLSANGAFGNEFVLTAGRHIVPKAENGRLILEPRNTALAKDFTPTFVPPGNGTWFLPLPGILVARDSVDTLENKTLAAPKLSGLVNATNDATAAAAGVAVGGVYHNAGALRVRLA